jgi:hypothetical protein
MLMGVWGTVVNEMPQNVEARLTLVSLLCDLNQSEEAIALLAPPESGQLHNCLCTIHI